MTDLQKISKKIRELTAKSCGSALRVAELLLQAKEEFFANDSNAWVDWCRLETGYRRRSAFRLKKIAEILRDCKPEGVDLSAICGTNYAKIEEIARIEDVSEIKKFLKKYDVADLDREELRAAVNAFLIPDAVDAGERQLDFFAQLKLPTAEDIRVRAQAFKGALKAEAAADYGIVFFDMAALRVVELSTELRKHYSKELIEVIGRLTGKNLHALLDPIIAG